MDDSGTIISVLDTVKCVDKSIISGTDMIIDGKSTIIVVPHITIPIRDTIVDGTLTVIGDSETIISTLETVIGALDMENSAGPEKPRLIPGLPLIASHYPLSYSTPHPRSFGRGLRRRRGRR